MTKEEIKEGGYYETSTGRIGKAYAVTEKKLEQGIVDLFFEGAGCVVAGENYAPPSGVFKIDSLKPAKKS